MNNRFSALTLMDWIEIDLGITIELFNRNCFQSARFYALLSDYTRCHPDQVIETWADLVAFGDAHVFSVDLVNNALRQMVRAGLGERVGRGRYCWLDESAVIRLLGLTEQTRLYLRVPRRYCCGPLERYWGTVMQACGSPVSAEITGPGMFQHTLRDLPLLLQVDVP